MSPAQSFPPLSGNPAPCAVLVASWLSLRAVRPVFLQTGVRTLYAVYAEGPRPRGARAPCILAGGPAFSLSPWLALVVPALCRAARRGRAAPPVRAARYTEGAEDGENEQRTERPRREALPPARGLVPCATSFAIDP